MEKWALRTLAPREVDLKERQRKGSGKGDMRGKGEERHTRVT